ncbi:histidine phosphatase family protein [Henriciella barbarensis]|uniref:Histidine phosphatase family protein n=1 Tax=Henriciella barbarensis TaxID=86342 RepID=A0A399QQP9_9PROT|nr:histidine phosphatase family protein [Henriciella barbarensis]RIJ20505.1 histidine phosphatase family protein [Henriciella barbarensis]
MSAARREKDKTARGPIIVSRHGRPALDRTAGPRLDWREYRDWWDRYEIGSLAEGQQAPENLKEAVADADIILSSTAPRAVETAMLATGREPETFPVFVEAPLPPPRLRNRKYLPKTWNIIARTAWLYGHSLDGESNRQARDRANKAAQHLHEAAADGKVYLAAHGWFNRMLRPAMARIGWVCVRDGGDKYWSYRIYEYRGKS